MRALPVALGLALVALFLYDYYDTKLHLEQERKVNVSLTHTLEQYAVHQEQLEEIKLSLRQWKVVSDESIEGWRVELKDIETLTQEAVTQEAEAGEVDEVHYTNTLHPDVVRVLKSYTNP